MTKLSDIRRDFLGFFEQRDHLVLPSSALVPQHDPTLMFTNAGMNQFKHVFTGAEKPPDPPRAATAQKVVRAGGKHNDLDNVGYTARHLTFFEMLGNFSFGDYFKADAIAYAWELLTKDFGLPPEKLSFTVYHDDDEAFEAWRKVTGCAEERILRVPTADNFWSMGDTGPCGPCSEVFYDHGEGISGQWALDAQGHDLFDERFVEIWNLVFMQYEQHGPDERTRLPRPCVDTGMGLERMASVLQGVHNVFEIDLFRHLIGAIKDRSGIDLPDHTASYNVIADHLRSSCFLIADGVLPSNEGRGYVLRRIMRRAMRHAHLLGCKEPLMHRLVPAMVAEMGEHYTELERAGPLIGETLKTEEERFRETLERGLKLLEEESAALSPGDRLSGDAAFKLYDTYGFPLDLTQDILRARHIGVDTEGFNAAMAEQKNRARAAWSGSGEAAVQEVWFAIRERAGPSEFTGYDETPDAVETTGTITAIVKDGKPVEALEAGESGLVSTDRTPFYGESGGQTGDTGTLWHDSARAEVNDTTKPLPELHAHHVRVTDGTLRVGETVRLRIDTERRQAIRVHHSATHLLHAALRLVLGEHVAQKGSLVTDTRLRFDFSHPAALSREEWERIEAEVNRIIRQNTPAITALMNKDEAIAAGAIAMFGEKYDDMVRVLSMGALEGDAPYSIELCGGTHVARTGDIGLFKIVAESAIASGVRRIEAAAGDAAWRLSAQQDATLRELGRTLGARPEELGEKVARLQNDRKQLEKQLAEAKKQLALGGGVGTGAGSAAKKPQVETVAGTPFIGQSFDALPPKELRDIATQLAQQHPEALIAVASQFEGKASVIVAAGKALGSAFDAAQLVQAAVPVVGGKGGGGKPHFAQCGGPDGDRIDAAIEAVKARLAEKAAAA